MLQDTSCVQADKNSVRLKVAEASAGGRRDLFRGVAEVGVGRTHVGVAFMKRGKKTQTSCLEILEQ